MSKHTPGPWRIGTPPPNGEQTIGTEQSLMVAVATTGADIPTKANAHLIAAAPDLLKACQMMSELPKSDDWLNALRKVVTHARAAIAKAKGETA